MHWGIITSGVKMGGAGGRGRLSVLSVEINGCFASVRPTISLCKHFFSATEDCFLNCCCKRSTQRSHNPITCFFSETACIVM